MSFGVFCHSLLSPLPPKTVPHHYHDKTNELHCKKLPCQGISILPVDKQFYHTPLGHTSYSFLQHRLNDISPGSGPENMRETQISSTSSLTFNELFSE